MHCSQRFKRQDVFQRHSRQFCRGQQNRVSVDNLSSRSRSRTSTACQHCRAHKVKCDGLNPCTRCVRKQQVCSFTVEGVELTTKTNISGHGSDPPLAFNIVGAYRERSGANIHQDDTVGNFESQEDCFQLSIHSPQSGQGLNEISP